MLVIALGWKDGGGKTTPKVYYCGSDVDEALKALNMAGKAKAISLGQVLRGVEDRVIHRVAFDS